MKEQRKYKTTKKSLFSLTPIFPSTHIFTITHGNDIIFFWRSFGERIFGTQVLAANLGFPRLFGFSARAPVLRSLYKLPHIH